MKVQFEGQKGHTPDQSSFESKKMTIDSIESISPLLNLVPSDNAVLLRDVNVGSI